jgi:hypothetical protein
MLANPCKRTVKADVRDRPELAPELNELHKPTAVLGDFRSPADAATSHATTRHPLLVLAAEARSSPGRPALHARRVSANIARKTRSARKARMPSASVRSSSRRNAPGRGDRALARMPASCKHGAALAPSSTSMSPTPRSSRAFDVGIATATTGIGQLGSGDHDGLAWLLRRQRDRRLGEARTTNAIVAAGWVSAGSATRRRRPPQRLHGPPRDWRNAWKATPEPTTYTAVAPRAMDKPRHHRRG